MAEPAPQRFTIAVIPDTQNYVDFTHQRAEGFAFDARDLMDQQLQFVADNAVSRGGDIVFATAVGDVWQHPIIDIDPDHAARGFRPRPAPAGAGVAAWADGVRNVEIPAATAAYDRIDGVLPFSVVSGNHDYDGQWWDEQWPQDLTAPPGDLRRLGMIHIGGLTAFTQMRSCGTETAVSVPCMFSNLTRGGYSSKAGRSVENLTDVLSHAHVDVRWLDNNTGSANVADRIPYEYLPATKDPRFCSDGECHDEILVEHLRTALADVRVTQRRRLKPFSLRGEEVSAELEEELNTLVRDLTSRRVGGGRAPVRERTAANHVTVAKQFMGWLARESEHAMEFATTTDDEAGRATAGRRGGRTGRTRRRRGRAREVETSAEARRDERRFYSRGD